MYAYYIKHCVLPSFIQISIRALLIGGLIMSASANGNAASESTDKDADKSEAKPKTEIEIQIEQAENEKKLLTLQKEIAEAKKAIREVDLPETKTIGLEGAIKVNKGAGYYAELLAYKSLDQLSAALSKDLADVLTDKVILTDNFELSNQSARWDIISAALDDMHAELDSLEEDYKDGSESTFDVSARKESLSAALTAAPAFLGSIADLTKFFRTDREVTNREIELTNRSLIASLAAALFHKGKGEAENDALTIILPNLQLHSEGQLVKRTQDLISKRRDALNAREKLRQQYQIITKGLAPAKIKEKALVAEVAKLEKEGKDATQKKEELADLRLKIARFGQYENDWKLIDARFDNAIKSAKTLVDTMTTRPAKGPSPLEAVATIDLIKKHNEAMILYVEIASKGSEIEIIKRVFWQDRVSYLGGVVVNYFLFDKDGTYKASGVKSSVTTASAQNKAEFKELEEDFGD